MAERTVTHYSCDRCKRDYDEVAPAAPGAPPKMKRPAAIIEAHLQASDISPLKVTFDDLCPKCDARVKALIDQIALPEKKDDGTSTSTSKEQSSESTPLDASAKPSDNKGSKDAGKAPTNPS